LSLSCSPQCCPVKNSHSGQSTALPVYICNTLSGNIAGLAFPSQVDDSPPAATSKASKQGAALHALRLLYQAGKLNDHLQPVWITQRHSKQLGKDHVYGGRGQM
jgi:hypothetical protein